VFLSKRRENYLVSNQILEDYIFHKQTYLELKRVHGVDRRRVQTLLTNSIVNEKVHRPRLVHIIVDATYFGDRKSGRSWCVLVARDPHKKENLAWVFADTETTYNYSILREKIEDLRYTIFSVTGDGFAGIRGAFHGIPFQMCQVHMERLVVEGTTRNPQTEAGQVLLAIVRTLHNTNSHTLTERLRQFTERYHDFLEEKTIHPLTGESSYTHEGLRKAYRSLMHLRKYLFTYEHNKTISKTTNSLEGHFKHLKKYLGIHGGLTRPHQQKILAIILQASSVSPSQETLNGLWK
jgi:Transposase IS66 family